MGLVPRCGDVTPGEWLRRRDYPFGAVIVDNTPYLFKKYLAEAKAWTLAKPESERIVVINSWNEWGEGSYMEPDTENGMGYLEAVRDVFEPGKRTERTQTRIEPPKTNQTEPP